MEWINEIKQQPEALRDYINALKTKNEWVDKIKSLSYDRVLLTGMGSSLFACYIVEEYLRKNGIFCTSMDSKCVVESSMSLITDKTLVVAVSQSGESPEVIELVNKMEDKSNLVVVVNYEKSSVYNCGGIVVPVCCGIENYSSSKSFTNTLAAVIALSEAIVDKSSDLVDEVCVKLENAAKETERIFEEIGLAEEYAEFIKDTKCLCCVGGSYSYTSASHMELIGEESAKIYGTRYTPSQFIHGPIELINEGFNALLFNTQKAYYEIMDNVSENVTSYGGKVLMITNNKDVKAGDNKKVYYINCDDEKYAPIVEIVLAEVAFYTLGVMKGEKPGHLNRVVKRIVK